MTPKSLSEETTPKRRKAMLWQKLGEGKDPEFNNEKGEPIVYFLCDSKHPDGPGYAVGTLHSITFESGGKQYKFNLIKSDGYQVFEGNITHFCIPVQP